MEASAHARVWEAAADKMKTFVEERDIDVNDRLLLANLCLLARCVATAYHNEATR